MPCVWVVSLGRSLRSYEIQDFVLALPRDARVRKDNAQPPPYVIPLQPLQHEVLQRRGEPRHELGARRDHVLVELTDLLGEPCAHLGPLVLDKGLAKLPLLCLVCASEASRPLLIHLGPWGDPVDGQVENLLRFDDAHDLVDVVKDVVEHSLLRAGLGAFLRVRAGVDDTVHVKVEVVELGVVGLDPPRDFPVDLVLR